MQKIGVIAPKDSKRRFKPQIIYNEKHKVIFIIINDNKNYVRAFKKYNTSAVICDKNAKLKHTEKLILCNGTDFFKNNLMFFLKKQLKMHQFKPENANLAIIFDKYDNIINKFIIQASKLFKYITFVTNKTECVKIISDRLIENYGLYIDIKSINDIIKCNIAVEVNDFQVNYKNNPVIININSNIILPNEYNISIPFRVNKAALAEALIAAKQSIDN